MIEQTESVAVIRSMAQILWEQEDQKVLEQLEVQVEALRNDVKAMSQNLRDQEKAVEDQVAARERLIDLRAEFEED